MTGLNQCEDILMFQRTIKKLRAIDDKIIFALNLSTPTKSFQARGDDSTAQCQDLNNTLNQSHQERTALIEKCVNLYRNDVASLAGSGDRAKRRNAQNLLRLYEAELDVEGIIRERTSKAFHDKCSEHL